MTANTKWFGLGLKTALDRALALGTPKIMFASATYVPDQDTNDFINDVSPYEVTGTGVVAGGLVLSGVVTAYDGSTNTANIDATDVSGISVVCCYGVLYVDTGNPSTSPVLTYTDLSEGAGTNVTVTGLTLSASGICAITGA